MPRRGVVNSLVAVVAILITTGLAAQAVIRGPGPAERSSLVAAGIDGRDSVTVESPTSTVPSIPTTQPAPTATTAKAKAAPSVPRSTITVTVPPAPDTTGAPPAPTTTIFIPGAPPVPRPATPPPAVVQTSPSSWSLEGNGVTVTASIEPAAPRAGDTVTISYTTAGEGDFCCWVLVFVDGSVVGQNRVPDGPCPVPPINTGSASVVAAEPGPFTFQIQASRIEHLCAPPAAFSTANLIVTFPVLPA